MPTNKGTFEEQIRIIANRGFEYACRIGWKTNAQTSVGVCFKNISDIAWAEGSETMDAADYRAVKRECTQIRLLCRGGRIYKDDVVNLWSRVRAIEGLCNQYLQPEFGEILKIDFRKKAMLQD